MKRRLLLLVVFGSLITLMGCSSGGGSGGAGGNAGGSNGGGGNENFSVEVTPRAINVVDDGSPASKMTWISAAGKGDPGVPLIYLDVQVDHEFVRPELLVRNGNEAIVNIRILDEAWGGTYRGNLIFSMCGDSQCKRHLADSPYTIPYTVQVKKSHIRYEPVSAPVDQLVEFSDKHLVISTESGEQAGPIRYRVELDDHLGSLIFPPEMLTEFGVTDVSADGFTLHPPALSDGSHLYQYNLGLSDFPDTELPLNIYYFVGREGGVKNQIIFMQNPVVIDVLYGHDAGNSEPAAKADYVATGIDRNLLDGMQFIYSYDNGVTDWMYLYESWQDGKLEFFIKTENLEVGTYTARVGVKKPHHQVEGAVDVIVNVADGILLQKLYPFSAEFESTYSITKEIGVRNTRDRAGTWTAETNTPWITLIDSAGEFSKPGEGQYVRFDIDLSEVGRLPNNQISEGTIRVTADDDSFSPAEVVIKIDKRLPEIKSMSLTQVLAAEAFTLDVTGMNFDLVHNAPVGLLAAGSEHLEETMFSVDFDSLTATKMTLSHPGVLVPGTYEVVFQNQVNGRYGHSSPLVPRTTITVVEP